MQTLTVSEMTAHLSSLIVGDPVLSDVWLIGEVSGYRPPSNNKGYRYFQLKDEQAVISCAIFRPLPNAHLLKDGLTIEAHGRVDVYAPRGTYSLIIDRFQVVSSRGALLEQLEQLKAKLHAEGLFDLARKRPLPAFPLRVGVVTSPTTAAFQDVRNVFARRFPLAQLIVSPTGVQGADAPPQIVQAIRRFDRVPVDVVLVCRGGGSVEDLWCFNDERVVRAVAACPVPVITGVGHEIDTTLVDYAADVRAPTPSAAAELLTPDVQQLRQQVQDYRHWLEELAHGQIAERRAEVERAASALQVHAPQRVIDEQRRRTDDLTQQMGRAVQQRLKLLRERLDARHELLMTNDLTATLQRGYAIVTNEQGQIVRRVADALADNNRKLTIRVQDGRLTAVIEGVTHDQAPDL
ncbi:exodeoxyribonuclease VII large subunit [Aggregatilineales bacterium SYSU G02658]